MSKVNILQIQQFQEANSLEEFYANTLENHIITRHKDIYLPHSHNFYLAILFTGGKGTHEVDFTTYTITPGALFFLNPGQTHHWDLSPDTKGFIFFHTKAFFDLHYTDARLSNFPFFYSMHNTSCVYLSGASMNKVTNLFKEVFYENHSTKPFKNEAILNTVHQVYIEGVRNYNNGNTLSVSKGSPGYYNKFRQFEELVNDNFRSVKSTSAYAGRLSITTKHLNRITQEVVGKTATDVILDRVLLEAKKMIVSQKQTFSQIGYELGYDDYAYFSRLFKQKTGETPSGFLNKYKMQRVMDNS